MSNLPSFPGAAVVYERAERIAAHLNAQEYQRQVSTHKGSRKRFRFSPNADAEFIISAMNTGDEEALKAAIANHLTVALGVAA